MMKAMTISAAVMAVTTGSAHAALLNWQLDPDGAGAAGRVTVNEYLDIGNSISYVSTTAPSGGSFTFSEQGAALITGHDGTANFGSFGGQITSRFTINGSGTLGGSLSYTGGTISIYAAPGAAGQYGTTAGTYGAALGTLIGSFQIIGGNGLIDVTGQPNGLQTVNARATNLAAGYWFNSSGQDLSTLQNFVLGLATTNASRLLNPNATAIAELGPTVFTNCLPGETGGACNGLGSFFISNNGQFRLDVAAIPEPSTYGLLGVGLAMIGFIARRRKR